MPDASFTHPNFLGGEWSPYAQGRIDHPKYRTAMSLCRNAYAIEEGACVRRPGFGFAATTRNGAAGRVLDFSFTDKAPYRIELTDGHLRLFTGRGLVFKDVQSVLAFDASNPVHVTVTNTGNWATGDQVQFLFNVVGNVQDCAILRNRQFTVTIVDAHTVTLADPVTGFGVDGSTVSFHPNTDTLQIARVLDFSTVYSSGTWSTVRSVQMADVGSLQGSVALLLHGKHTPYSLTAIPTTSSPAFQPFTFGPQAFKDGPYNDPPVGAVVTPSAMTGSIQLTISYLAWSSSTAYSAGNLATDGLSVFECVAEFSINEQPSTHPNSWTQVNAGVAFGPNGAQQTDVGRLIRLLSEPPLWDPAHSYSAGNNVKFDNAYYTCIKANTNVQPDQNLVDWLPASSSTTYTWTWGEIASVQSSNVFTINLVGPNLLYSQAIVTWQIGVFSDTTGWPTAGCYYEGRLWLVGAQPNRIDSSNSDDVFNFSPTASDGTVGDANSISAILNADSENLIYWIEPTSQGLVAGTRDGEWLLQASSLNDPLTPTSIQAHRVTKVKSANILPVHTPLTLVMANKYQRSLFELFPDTFSGKVVAPQLNIFAKHLSVAQIQELAYTSELQPIIWARNGDGSLVGCTYLRMTAFSTEEPKFVAFHRHDEGFDNPSGRLVESICSGPDPGQNFDSLTIVSNDPNTNIRHVEMATALLDPQSPLWSDWFVDDAVTPSASWPSTVNGVNGIVFAGLWHLNGHLISAVVAGLDCGDYTVVNGQIFVPFQSDPGQFFTQAYLNSISGNIYGAMATPLDTVATVNPAQASTPATVQWFPWNGPNLGTEAAPIVGAVDWGGEFFYPLTPSSSYDMRKVSLGNGTLALDATASQVLNGTDFSAVNEMMVFAAGNIYMVRSTAPGDLGPFTMEVAVVNTTTLKIVNTFTVTMNNFLIDTGAYPLGAIIANGLVYLVVFDNTLGGGVQMIDVTNQTALGFQALDNATQGFCNIGAPAGTVGPGLAVITGPSPNTGTTVALWIMSVDVSGTAPKAVYTKVRQYNPSDFVSTWTSYNASYGLIFDGNDGSVVAAITGNDNTTIMAKLRLSDGAILWKTGPVGNLPNATSKSMEYARTTGGVYAWCSNADEVAHVLSLASGTIYTFSVGGWDANGAVVNGAQLFDAQSGSLMAYSAFNSALSTISPAPGTPSSWTQVWSRLIPGSIFLGSTFTKSSLSIPATIGYTYTTQAQLVRPMLPQDAGAANGPALAKTRRQHMFGVLLAGAIYGTVKFGTLFSKVRSALFKSAGDIPFDTKTPFSGIYWHTLEDNYSFDSQLCWQVTRPHRANVCAIGGFIHTQDR